MKNYARGIMSAALLAVCAACPAALDQEAARASGTVPAAPANSGDCAAASEALAVRILRVDSLPERLSENRGTRGPWYSISDGAGTSFAGLQLPATDLNSDGELDLVLYFLNTGIPGGRMVAVYVHCGADRYATLWEPEYAYDMRLGESRAGLDGRGWRDLILVERADSNDPNRDYLASHLLRFQGERFAKVDGTERILPTGSNDCPAGGRYVYVLGWFPEDSARSPAVQVVPNDTVRIEDPAEFPLPVHGRQSWRGDLNGDGKPDQIVSFPGTGGSADAGVYAGCGGHAYVEIWKGSSVGGVLPGASSTRHDAARWKDLVLRGTERAAPQMLRFDGRRYRPGR